MQFKAIGTAWVISSTKPLADVEEKVMQRIAEFDITYSRFKSDSRFRKMADEQGTFDLPNDARDLLDFYKKLYTLSDGLVTPLIGRTLEQAGYDPTYSFKPSGVTSPPSWDEALDYDFPKLTIKQQVIFDFGAAGKGYLVDIIGKLLKDEGYEDFCINAGGDILVYGVPQRVGLENPDDTTQAIGIVDLDGALCGSAGNRRRWEGFHHTINPKTLTSPENIKAIWVRAETAMLADGLTTALYFVDPQELRKHFAFEYAMIKGTQIEASQGFGAEFFS